MDELRFDTWARTLAHRLPRRTALGVLAALGLLRTSTRATMARTVESLELDGADARQVSCDWTGVWSTDWGAMRLTQAGTSVTGDYDHDQGAITGTVSGTELRGAWTEAPSRKPPSDAGDFAFTMAPDCQTFTGTWRYGSSGDMNAGWSGKRTGELTDAQKKAKCKQLGDNCRANNEGYCARLSYEGEGKKVEPCIAELNACCAHTDECNQSKTNECFTNSVYYKSG